MEVWQLIALFLVVVCGATTLVILVVAVTVIVIVCAVSVYFVLKVRDNEEFPFEFMNQLIYDSIIGEKLNLKRNPYDNSVYSSMKDAFGTDKSASDKANLMATTDGPALSTGGEELKEGPLKVLAEHPNESTPLGHSDEGSLEKKDMYRAVFNFEARDSDEVSFEIGDQFELVEVGEDDWWKVKNKEGQIGMVPSNYLSKMA